MSNGWIVPSVLRSAVLDSGSAPSNTVTASVPILLAKVVLIAPTWVVAVDRLIAISDNVVSNGLPPVASLAWRKLIE